jgi:hypothetical protein
MNPFYLGLIIGVSMGIGIFIGMIRMLFYVHNTLGFSWELSIREYAEHQKIIKDRLWAERDRLYIENDQLAEKCWELSHSKENE